jgi:hypothetical protein
VFSILTSQIAQCLNWQLHKVSKIMTGNESAGTDSTPPPAVNDPADAGPRTDAGDLNVLLLLEGLLVCFRVVTKEEFLAEKSKNDRISINNMQKR